MGIKNEYRTLTEVDKGGNALKRVETLHEYAFYTSIKSTSSSLGNVLTTLLPVK